MLSVTALVYGRPQKLVIKTDKESVELRYWPLDGKQLPFYSLYSPVIVTCRQMTEIELPCNETIYKISLGKGKTSLVYATAGAVDTVSLYRDSVYFSGHNQTYNLYLEEAEKPTSIAVVILILVITLLQRYNHWQYLKQL